jgi:hypothetical protein
VKKITVQSAKMPYRAAPYRSAVHSMARRGAWPAGPGDLFCHPRRQYSRDHGPLP